jgi:tetratricopeptide (TPR) repeat protein
LLGNEIQEGTGPLDALDLASAESKLAIQLAPNSIEAHRARGFILEVTANREEAIQEYQAAIAINSNIPDLHLDLGRMYKALGVTDKALQEYTLANTLNPSDPRAALYSSRALAAVGRYDQAAQYAEEAVKVALTDPYMRGNWGVMLYKNVQIPEAITQLSLTINGGTTADGQIIKPLPLAGDDLYVTGYYFTYAIALARANHCGEAVLVANLILGAVPANQDAVVTATEALRLCQQNLLTPSPVPTVIITPTP